MVKKIVPIFFYFCAAIVSAQSQFAYHEVFSKREGLELDNIQAMAFDSDGFLWLGGTNLDNRKIIFSEKKIALQRFNGKSFHSITLPEEAGDAISVDDIYKRSDGKFYVSGKNDSRFMFEFDPFTAEFRKIDLPNSDATHFSASRIFRYEDTDFILLQNDRTISLYQIEKNSSFKRIFSFTSSENKFLLDQSTVFIPFEDYCIIGDDNFPITILDWYGNVLKKFHEETFKRNRDIELRKVWIDKYFVHNNSLYCYMDDNPELYYFNTTVMDFESSPVEDMAVNTDIFQTANDSMGNHIICTIDDGFIKLGNHSESGIDFRSRLSGFDEVEAFQVQSRDFRKDIWIGTSGGELHYVRFPSNLIKTYFPNEAMRFLTQLDSVNYLAATDHNGWFTFNRHTNESQLVSLKEGSKEFSPLYSFNLVQRGDTIYSHTGGDIIEVNLTERKVKSYKHYPALCLKEASDSTLIYGTNGYYLMEFNTRTKVNRPLINTDTLAVYDVEIDQNAGLVIGATDKGMLRYDLKSEEARMYTVSDGLEDQFMLMADYQEDHGYLLGTRSGLIYTYDPKSDTLTKVYEDDLKAGIATILFEDSTWWINTFNGVVAFNPDDQTKYRFSDNDGLSNNEANRHSALKTEDGLWVGTINGLNFFRPEELKPTSLQSDLVLLRVKRFNSNEGRVVENMNRQVIEQSKEIILPAEYKELEIDFALTANMEGRENSFSYRMDDSEWIDLKDEQSIRFPILSAGKYELEIEARDFSGNRIGQPLLFNINSKEFFYNTWWFYTLTFLLLSSMLFYFYMQALEKRKMQEQFTEDLLNSREKERTRIAKDLHDSVGQQLTLIKKKAQQQDVNDISELTHKTLEEVRGISRGLYPSVLNQLGLSESIEQLLLELDEQTDIFFTSEIDNIDGYLKDNAALNFYRFVQECMSNVLKHSEATSVSVNIKKIKNNLITEIKDNGKGFHVDEAARNRSLGLTTLSERIRILGGQMDIQSKLGKGTTINAQIPVS